jgi:hypothetical protein
MLQLTEKIFVPVSVNDELPKDKTAVFILENRGSSTLIPRMNLAYFEYPTNFNTGDEEDNYPTHWLKEETNKYVLSKEQIEQLISEAFDRGSITNSYINGVDTSIDEDEIKNKYINSILKNEK